MTTIAKIMTASLELFATLGNCRPTRSHATQTKDSPAYAPYESMLHRGEAGLPLWDPSESARAVSVSCWSEVRGENIDDIGKAHPGAVWTPLSGNCRLKTLVDAIKELTKRGIVLLPEQLVVPFIDVSESIKTPLDIIAEQVGSNESPNQRIKISPQEKLAIAIDAKKRGMELSGTNLKHRLKLDRHYVQRIGYMASAWNRYKCLKARLLKAPVDVEKRKNISYTPTCALPIEKMPHHKIHRLELDIKKAVGSKQTALVASFAADVEALLCVALTGSANVAAATMGIQGWRAAAEETMDDSVTNAIKDGVESDDLTPVLDSIGEIMESHKDDAIRWHRIGRAIEEAQTDKLAHGLCDKARRAEEKRAGIDKDAVEANRKIAMAASTM